VAVITARGPGRVNLIGEHTDYNEGLALPFAIDRGVTVTAETRDDDTVTVDARDLGEADEFALTAGERFEGWRAFPRGMVAELQRAGYVLSGCTLTVAGDLEQGAGLSSSAALEAALALALLAVAGEDEPADRRDLARLCSAVENDWVGAETGLLDQLASLCSQPGHALRIDFRTLELEAVPLDLKGHTLITLDSGTTHSHAASGYNERRRECREACEQLGIGSLREASDVSGLDEPLRSRARHVIEENARVDAMVAALHDGDEREVGRLLDASHASLRDLYDASTPEVERTVEQLKQAGALGARMVGGGFGGAVLALLGPGARIPAGALRVAPGPPAAVGPRG
jgi:galactokinase